MLDKDRNMHTYISIPYLYQAGVPISGNFNFLTFGYFLKAIKKKGTLQF